MKGIAQLILLILTTTITIVSCKKGDDDPLITLHSRKARVIGDWNIKKLQKEVKGYNYITSDPSPNTQVTSYAIVTSHDGSIITENSVFAYLSGDTLEIPSQGTILEHSYKFNKDGTWSSIYELDNSTSSTIPFAYIIREVNTKTKTVQTGTWSFLGKTNETKNKERLVLFVDTQDIDERITITTTVTATSAVTILTRRNLSSTTFIENENSKIWKITQLKNKEMIIETNENVAAPSNLKLYYTGLGFDYTQTTSTAKSNSVLTLVTK